MLNQPEGAEWEKSERFLSAKMQCVCLELGIGEWRGSGGWLGLPVGGTCHAAVHERFLKADEQQDWVCEARLYQMGDVLQFFYGWIYKKIASYRYYAAGIRKMKPCPDPGGGRWMLCSGPRSVCQRGPCWLQWRLRQVREVWKGGGRWTWALLGRVVPVVRRRHQELPEQLRV